MRPDPEETIEDNLSISSGPFLNKGEVYLDGEPKRIAMKCPSCGSKNISPVEQEYKADYPFWIVLAVAFSLIGILLLLFFILQLHPVIIILVLVAVVSKLLDTRKRRKRKIQNIEYICLKCDHRFFH